jgi:threonine dehydrogenase-like Zn-dependent dehydrogenase
MPNTNRVLTIPEPGKTGSLDLPYPKVAPGYVLVKVAIAPICIEHQIYRDHTFEWHEDENHLGHEGVGTIVEVTEGSAHSVGDRVVIYQGNPCGECFVCQEGLSPTHCMAIPYEEMPGHIGADPHAAIASLGGDKLINTPGGPRSIEIACNSESGGFGFAQYRLAPESMVQKLPDDLPFRYAAAANCSNGCTYSGVEEAGTRNGDIVLVGGIGFIGFGAIINAKYRGATVIALGRNKFRMDLARKIGADYVIDPDDPDWLAKIHEITGDKKGCDAVFECSGYPYYQKKCLAAVRRYGQMRLFGFLVGSEEPLPIHLLDEIHNRHVTLSGSHDVNVNHREGLIEMLRDPEVQRATDLMITHEFNMSDAAAAFEACLSKKAGKVYLYPHDDCPVSDTRAVA